MKVKSIGVEFGVSIATGEKAWIKANSKMEVEFDSPTDNTDDAFEKAWGRVTHEVNEQVSQFDVMVVKKG